MHRSTLAKHPCVRSAQDRRYHGSDNFSFLCSCLTIRLINQIIEMRVDDNVTQQHESRAHVFLMPVAETHGAAQRGRDHCVGRQRPSLRSGTVCDASSTPFSRRHGLLFLLFFLFVAHGPVQVPSLPMFPVMTRMPSTSDSALSPPMTSISPPYTATPILTSGVDPERVARITAALLQQVPLPVLIEVLSQRMAQSFVAASGGSSGALILVLLQLPVVISHS